MGPIQKKIVIGVLAVSIVTIILALGLGLGLQLEKCQNEVVPASACRGRCYEPFDEHAPGCRCDAGCVASGNCCNDFHDLCLQAVEQWQCTKLRCGEKRLPASRCHCTDDCLSAADCCTNYKHVCHGEKQWVEDECEDVSVARCPAGFKQQPLLLVSLDGLRADYLRKWSSLTPVLDKLSWCGTSTRFMQASFPSKTFPNHYAIVTGLYPESNGLIDNAMYDPEFDAYFTLSNAEKNNPRWYLGQPIWHTAKYQGLKAGTFFWPGSEVKINGSYPDIYKPYNGKVPFEERVFNILKWLQFPDEKRPDFYTLYLEEPDKSGHKFGTVSGGVIEALQGVDNIIAQLMNGLKQIQLHRCVNIIIVADHGMEDTSCERKEVLQNLVGRISELWVVEGPFGRIRAKNKGTHLDSAGLVANMTCKKLDQKIRPYLKPHLPKRLHFANSLRIEDVNVLVTPKWLFERSPGSLTFCSGGAHGYDNDIPSMHAMFISYGPKFLHKTEVEPFSNIELYNLMCDVLEIHPSDNNGTHGSMNHLLRQPYFLPSSPVEWSPPGHCPLLTLDPADNLGCSCPALNGTSINSRLNLTAGEAAAAMETHTPFGRPKLLQEAVSYCLLLHSGFVSGFSQDLLMPLWSSFTLDKPVNLDPLPGVLPSCLRADVRLPAKHTPRCNQFPAHRLQASHTQNLTTGFLYPPNVNSSSEQQFDALLMSNVVPMFPQFKRIWDYLHGNLLKRFAWQFNGANVVSGPVFDYNYDGRFDAPHQIQHFVAGTRIPVPTHFFVVVTSCRNASQAADACAGELQPLCFLLPHRADNSESCRSSESESSWVEDLMWFHQARVRDVEWITGLDFYQGSSRPVAELLRTKTRPTADIHRKP